MYRSIKECFLDSNYHENCMSRHTWPLNTMKTTVDDCYKDAQVQGDCSDDQLSHPSHMLSTKHRLVGMHRLF